MEGIVLSKEGRLPPFTSKELARERALYLKEWRAIQDPSPEARVQRVDQAIRAWIEGIVESGRYQAVLDLKPRSPKLTVGERMVVLPDGGSLLIREPIPYLGHRYAEGDVRPLLPLTVFLEPESALEIQQATKFMSDPRQLFLRHLKLSKAVPGAYPMRLDPMKLRVYPIASPGRLLLLKPMDDLARTPFYYDDPSHLDESFALSTVPITGVHRPGQKARKA